MLVVMKRQLSTAGKWLAGAAGVSVFGYLISTQSASGNHPTWPYWLFATLVVVGLIMYFASADHPRRAPAPSDENSSLRLPSGQASQSRPDPEPQAGDFPEMRQVDAQDGSATGERTQSVVRVFISYRHDQRGTPECVLNLAQQLRQDGLDAVIDQFVPFPKEGWVRWMQRQLAESNFTICVCTKEYCASFESLDDSAEGRGANWEGQMIAQYIYDAKGENSKFIPVMFAGGDESSVIPLALKPYTRFVLNRQYDELYRLLANRPTVFPVPLGPMRALRVVSPGVPQTALSLDAANGLESRIRVIAAGPGQDADEALDELERMAVSAESGAVSDAVISQLVSYISALDTSSTYPQAERKFRNRVIQAMIRMTDGRLNLCFTDQALSGVDLALFDFRKADLSGIDFSGSFMIECDFRDADLRQASFAGCSIRNARFAGASLDEADFSRADWFNSLDLTRAQLAACRTRTLMKCPATEQELFSYLDQNYGLPFSSWSRRVQEELRRTWAEYLRPGGLADEAARWNISGDS
jgi:hypothetical protein